MTLAHFFAILRARWASALLVLLLVAGAALAWALMRAPQYTATASVLVDVKSPDPIAGMVLQGTASPSYMITQVDVIQSLRVARHVVKALKLEENATLRAAWEKNGSQGSLETFAAEALRRGLDVRPSRGSNVISVAYSGADASFAALVANSFVQSYLATTLDLRVDPAKQYSTFFDARGKQLRDALEQAQAKLSAFQQSKGLVATDERLDAESARLMDLTAQVVGLEASAAESSSRKGQSDVTPDRMQEALSNPVVASLSAELARQETRLEELNPRLGSQNPQVIELQSSVAALKTKVNDAVRRVSGSVTINNTVTQSRLAQARAARDAQRSKLLNLKGQRDEAMVLQRDVENAQRAYDGVLARLNQTSLESQTAQTNVSALEYATAPVRPSSIGWPRALGIGLLLGAVLACVTVLVREWRDRRLRTQEEFPGLVNQPLIGVVPAFRKKPGRGLLSLGSSRQLGQRRSGSAVSAH